MGRRFLGYSNCPLKPKHSGIVHNINKQTISGSRVILLDSALELQATPTTWTFENHKNDFPEAPKRQDNRTVFELNDHVSLIKTCKRPKVNFVDFIDSLKVKTENNNVDDVNENQEFDQIKLKQKLTEEFCSESNKNTLVLEQDRTLKTKDNKIINISKPVLNLIPATDQICLKQEQERYKNQMKKQTVQIETQPLKLTEFSPAHHLTSSADCRNISKIHNERQLLNKKIYLKRVIKLRPLNLNAFKSSQKKKDQQLSSILKIVIKNNVSNELQQSSTKEEAFPVALRSTDHEDIKLLDAHQMNQSSEQILGI